jgi:hypothetical protein
VPVATAIGTNPSEATSAVITTGRRARQRTPTDGFMRRHAFVDELPDECQHDEAIEHRNAR